MALFTPLLWPGRTVRLERNSLLDYRNRSTSAQVSVAELYHENSKLSSELLPELIGTSVDPAELREEFFTRRAALAGAGGGDQFDGIGVWKELLHPVAERGGPALFYAIELRLVAGNILAEYQPAGRSFHVLKHLDEQDRGRLVSSLSLVAGDGLQGDESLIFLLACFPRNEILLGQRGYRRTLIEAGQIAEEVLCSAAHAGRESRIYYEFADRDVDLIMEVDGVEQSTVIAIACR